MSWPASQVDAYFLAEDDGALEARERYNFSRAQQKEMEAAKGFERLAVSMHRYSTSQAPIIAQARKSRRIILLMPTIAGTAEIVYTELFQTARSAQLWDICRDALNDHRFVEVRCAPTRTARRTRSASRCARRVRPTPWLDRPSAGGPRRALAAALASRPGLTEPPALSANAVDPHLPPTASP